MILLAETLTWPEAFAAVGVPLSFALVLFVLLKYG